MPKMKEIEYLRTMLDEIRGVLQSKTNRARLRSNGAALEALFAYLDGQFEKKDAFIWEIVYGGGEENVSKDSER